MARENDVSEGISAPAGWSARPLSSLLEVEFAGAWGEGVSSRNANVCVLRSTNLDDDGNLNCTSGAPRVFSNRDLREKVLRSGDILLEASGGGPGKPVGRVALFGDPGESLYASSNFFRTLRPNSNTLPEYLVLHLLRFYKKPSIWALQQQTTGIINLKYRKYLTQPVLVPPIGEQKEIVASLEAVGEAIRLAERYIAKLERQKRGALDALLTHDMAHWNSVTVGDILAERPRNGYSPHAGDSFSGTYMLGLGCLSEIGFAPTQLKYAPANDQSIGRALLEDGDLLISRANTRAFVGMVGRYSDVGFPCIYPDLMMRLRASGAATSEFLELLLRSSQCRGQIQSAATGTSESMVKISSRTVMGLRARIPEIDEQRRIVELHDCFVERGEAAELELAKLRKMRLGLMDDLLTGRVRVGT
jgi:type I restriction enzyme, S subunit